MTVCNRIDCVLKARGISRRRLAIKAGIAPSSLQSALQRNGNLSLEMLQAISTALNLPLSVFEASERVLREWHLQLEAQIAKVTIALHDGECSAEETINLVEKKQHSNTINEAIMSILNYIDDNGVSECDDPVNSTRIVDFEIAKLADVVGTAILEDEIDNALQTIKETLYRMNDAGRKEAVARIQELSEIPRYQREYE